MQLTVIVIELHFSITFFCCFCVIHHLTRALKLSTLFNVED